MSANWTLGKSLKAKGLVNDVDDDGDDDEEPSAASTRRALLSIPATQSIKGKPVLALHECSTPHAWLLLQNFRRGHKRSERECPEVGVRRAETASLALAVLLHLPFFLRLH
jgi:hypothetical protein